MHTHDGGSSCQNYAALGQTEKGYCINVGYWSLPLDVGHR